MRALTPILILALAGAVQAQTVQLTPLPKGASVKIGGYRPQRLVLSADQPATITKLPQGLKAPAFGILPIGAGGKPGVTYHIVVDEPEGAAASLYIDSNGNGDLTDDAAADWKARETPGKDGAKFTQYNGGGAVELAFGGSKLPAHVNMYRFDKTDPARAAYKDVVLYYADYAYEGQMTFGGKTLKVMLVDDLTTGDFRGAEIKETPGKDGAPATKSSSGVRLLVDANGNGKFERRGEDYDVRQPFNIGGTTYEIADMDASGASFKLVRSEASVAEILPPPDHSVGQKVTAFTATDTAGKPVKFPGDYKGKIVMIDFWATWCGPCMGEVPNLVKNYEAFHNEGFEVLGISLDHEKTLEKIAPVTKEHGMTWRQVADGKYWKADIAQLYVVNAIPAAYLVDGDTGEILADSSTLRGERLKGTIEKALAKKKADSKS